MSIARLAARQLTHLGRRRLGVSTPAPSLSRFAMHTRWVSTTSTTVLAHPPTDTAAATTPQAVLVYFNNLYPIKLARFDPSTIFASTDRTRLKERVAAALPSALRKQGVAVASVDPRLKDGGAFVELMVPAPLSVTDALAEINTKLGSKGWMDVPSLFYWAGAGAAYPVLGVKFNEDIASLTPSMRLKVEASADVSMETLYEALRPFGEITDIRHITPKSAYVQFKHIRSATSARNCTYKLTLADGITLKSGYEKLIKPHHIWDWLASHPRIVLPLLIALGVTLGVAIFDPIHIFFVESKLIGRFRLGWDRLFDLFPSLSAYFPSSVVRAVNSGMTSIASHMPGSGSSDGETSDFPHGIELDDFNGGEAHIPRLRSLMYEPPESLVVISGPHGVGKSELAHTVTTLPEHPHAPKIVIDCDQFIGRANSDADVIRMLAGMTGYYPLMYSLNKLTSYLDVAMAAIIGAKTNVSVSDEMIVKNMLECASMALMKVTRSRAPTDPYPVVVLDNFLKDKPGKSFSMYYDALAQWAGFLVEAGIAHVVVVASSGQRGGGEVGVLQAIGRSMPTKTIDVVALSDMTPSQAHQYLRLRLAAEVAENAAAAAAAGYTEVPAVARVTADRGAEAAADKTGRMWMSESDADRVVAALGGRASDLELLTHKLADGKPVDVAIAEMELKAMLEIQKHGLHSQAWTPAQFWYVARQLQAAADKAAKADAEKAKSATTIKDAAAAPAVPAAMLSFDKIRFSTLFGGSDGALYDMERAELVALSYESARPTGIRMHKQLYSTALARLVNDKQFAATMDAVLYKELCKVENKKIGAWEDEYVKLAEAVGRLAASRRSPDAAIGARMTHLAQNMEASQKKVEDWWAKYLAAKSSL
ncbi:RNA12 protein-domain-containing protein [Blastocladiella britannica]|nr:RNA12 protein-domain-containing protein [Blastocladiella britannica]